MSLSSNFPTIRPSLLLDFANVGRLDPRVTFTRATTATYYDGVTTAVAEQNLFLRSQEFDTGAIWGPTGTSVSANDQTAPDGTNTAETLTASAGSSGHLLSQQATLVSGASYVVSFFVKAGTHSYAQIATGAQNIYANFDVTAGTVGTSSGMTASIVSVGNSWYRCIAAFTQSTANSVYIALASSSSDLRVSVNPWTAVGTETIFIWGAQLEQRSSVTAYTATTTQAITNYIPVLLTAQNDVPRFDHTPTTGAALGLLIEEQRTNSLTYSDDFANAAWTKTRSSITSNTIVAPDGTLTGDKLVEDTTASDTHIVRQIGLTITNATPYLFSVYLKAGERTKAILQTTNTGFSNNAYVIFDLIAGTVVSNVSATSAAIVDVGNGWYRCSMGNTSTGTAGNLTIGLVDAANNPSYTGDGYSGIYIWGAQLEAGAFATSYIPTTTTALTRNADAASMTGTNFSSWFNAAEGTLVSVSQRAGSSNSASIVAINDGTTGNRLQTRADSATSITNFIVLSGSVNFTQTVAFGANSVVKSALAYKTNDVNAAINGVAGTTDTSETIPSGLNTLQIGNVTNVAFLNGWLQRIAFYPQRLPNATLQALTL